MMLRNRDLNVQPAAGAGAPLPKRQSAHLVKVVGGASGRASSQSSAGSDRDSKYEPRPKRACSQKDKENSHYNNNNHNKSSHNKSKKNTSGGTVVPVTAFSRSLLIDSAKKDVTVVSTAVDAGGGGALAAPIVGRKRSSALLSTRDSNVGEHMSSTQKEEKHDDEQKMEQDNGEQQQQQEEGLFDFDKENDRDMSALSQYAQDIFTYYKYRERFFKVSDYIRAGKHLGITVEIRAKLIDWMVELQETFELNHETLYLAVKLVDMFLNRTTDKVVSTQMQLIASAALFVASKFDERAPPLIDDFIYLAEDSFTREQILDMERVLLKEVNFDLGSPLSYRFLRRYARVCKLDMGTLTLARYVLETSLMFLDYCRISESRIAAACLLLALRMKGIGEWGPVLHKYTGFKHSDIEPLMWRLNRMIIERKQHYPDLDTVFRKYSHEIFFEVAKTKQLREH
ncbi:hypothetical protein niasHS_005300 [Heterodera schachtii]|uniref:G2/mitotic-specific cyclin-B3 n=1 Tax=Heterodera schachtii TaxID=97005 RepID=A0ABD2J8W5_HETSC